MISTILSFARKAAFGAICTLAAVSLTCIPARAFGGGGGGGGGGKPACSSINGKNACNAQSHCYWSNSQKRCKTKKNQLHGSSDRDRYAQAVSLIEEGEYTAALGILWSIENREDPKVLNYIGYSTRKLGNVEKGIGYYHRALAIDPDYVRAREYLGEGYLQLGKVAEAREQLGEIAARCGTDCIEYAKLTEAIVPYMTGELQPKSRTW